MTQQIRDYVERARKLGGVPRVHGNGMIQLDMMEQESRLHFWGHHKIPHQKVYTPIHDHVFNFESTVLMGAITNIHYVVTTGQTFTMWEAQPREGHDTMLCITNTRCNLRVTKADTIQQNRRYRFEHRRFHETLVVEPTVTIMRKLNTVADGSGPFIAIKTGDRPDNEFNRHAHPDAYLWGIIDEMSGGS